MWLNQCHFQIYLVSEYFFTQARMFRCILKQASLKVVQSGSVPLIQLLPLGFSEHKKDLVLTAINGLLSGANVGTSGVLLVPQSVAKKVCMLEAKVLVEYRFYSIDPPCRKVLLL